MSIKYFDLYYTVIKNRDEKQNVIDKHDENDYINCNHFMPNHNISIKPRETTLRYREI